MSEESFAAGLVGSVLDGRYRLDALLGEGGMGAVYRAHHLAMDRKVAVKLLKPHLSTDDNAVQRFLREARSTMKVDSEHAVTVFDFGVTPQSDYYMVLEYLDGRTVQRELDVDGPFAPARVVHIAKQALQALGAAHERGLIHRDIKPDNILLMRVGDDPDYAKVLDFGVAKLMDGAASSARSALAITQAGMVFGTPEYMSPEQACGQKLDGRSDLYSLAATMFAMVTGCGMYNAKTAIEWLTHHARTPAPHLATGKKELAPYTALDQALQRCLAKRREDRPQSAKEMIALLASIEPTLGRSKPHDPAASSSARGHAMRAAPSSYIEAIDPNATLLPGAPVAVGSTAATADSPYAKTMMPMSREALGLTSPASDAYARTMLPSDAIPAVKPASSAAAPTTTGVIAEMRGSRRGTWLALGGTAIVAMIVAVVIVASRGGHPRKAAVAAKDAEPPIGSARSVVTVADAAVPDPAGDRIAMAGSGSAGSDSATRTPPDKATPAATPDKRKADKGKPNPEVARLVGEAEAAQRAGNRLRQIATADAALQLDPRNTRATLLLADGLLATGDRDRGCKYLRDLGRNPTARSRAAQAGCPTD